MDPLTLFGYGVAVAGAVFVIGLALGALWLLRMFLITPPNHK